MFTFSFNTNRQTTHSLTDGAMHSTQWPIDDVISKTLLIQHVSKCKHNYLNLFSVLFVQKWLKFVNIWQSCNQMYAAMFTEQQPQCSLVLFFIM